MNTMKRFLATMVAVLLMASMLTVPASAYDVTINGNASGHTYEAYQIFSGKISEQNGKKILSDIQWGEGVVNEDNKADRFLNAIKDISYKDNSDNTIKPFANVTTAQSVADELAKFTSNGVVVDAFAAVMGEYLIEDACKRNDATQDSTYIIDELAAGYYLIKDKDNSLPGEGNPSAPNENENDLYTKYLLAVVGDASVNVKGAYPTITKKVSDVEDGDYGDATDVLVNDLVFFELRGTLPSNFSDYQGAYKYIFTDVSSSAIELDETSVKLYRKVHNVSGLTELNLPDGAVTLNNDTLTVTINNLKALTVAATGAPVTLALSDTIVVRYTGKLYDDETTNIVVGGAGNRNTATLTYTNDPNERNPDATSTTSSSEVAVYTYRLDIKKVNTDEQPLKDAKFHVIRKTSGEDEFAVVDDNGYLIGWTLDEEDTGSLVGKTLFTTGDDGYIKIKGIDEGSYWLREHEAPDGYNMLTSDVNVRIGATFDATNTTKLASLTMNDSANGCNVTAGSVEIPVENKSGATLPETGGMGTTLFYVAGAVLMIGAGAVLATKKRTQK